jgi:hypothetical protein
VDVRHFGSPAQSDTFFVRFQPANNAYPVRLHFREYLKQFFERVFVEYSIGDSVVTADVTETFSLLVENEDVHMVTLITQGPRAVPPDNK